MQARSRKLAACWTGVGNKSQLSRRDNLKVQHFGDDNVQDAIVREVRFLGMKTHLAFSRPRVRQEGLLHWLSVDRKNNCCHLNLLALWQLIYAQNKLTGYGS